MTSDISIIFAILLFPLLGVIAVSSIVTLLVFYRKKTVGDKINQSYLLRIFGKVFICILLLSGIGFIIFNVIPEQTHNKNWAAKQELCAQQAGFNSAREAFSSSDASSVTFQQCLR